MSARSRFTDVICKSFLLTEVGKPFQLHLQKLVKKIVHGILQPRKIFEEELSTSDLTQNLIRWKSEFPESPADCLVSHANVSLVCLFLCMHV